MADSLDTTVAKAIKAALEDGTFSQTFTPERIYFPLFSAETTRTLRVVVVQKDHTSEVSTKTKNDHSITCMVVICVPIPKLDHRTEAGTILIDTWRAFAEEIQTYLLRRDLGDGVGVITAVRIGDGQIFDVAALLESHVFLAPISCYVSLTN